MRRLARVTFVFMVAGVLYPTAAYAQVSANPTNSGMPGAALAAKIINWLMWATLMACLGTMLFGAALWRGGTQGGNYGRAADGKHYALGGAVGALIAGLAVTAVNTLFAAGRAG
jgi:hypothetical protein